MAVIRRVFDPRLLVTAASLQLSLGAAGCRAKDSSALPEAAASSGGSSALQAPPDVAAAPANAERTASGLASLVLRPGTGTQHPALKDRVRANYTGWTRDGQMFDTSATRGRPEEFGVTEVISGWTEGLQLMTVGEKRRFWIPAQLAYGDVAPAGQPSGQLTFDVELVEIVARVTASPVPSDLTQPPTSAEVTSTGLRYVVLKPGDGTKHPLPENHIRVIYSGWTHDGKLFDSSARRGHADIVAVDGGLPGWTEGVQLMTVGEKRRLWVPETLAYGEKSLKLGAPAGPLVFDVELIEIM